MERQMTLRYKIANVISGGAITEWQNKWICENRFRVEAEQDLRQKRRDYEDLLEVKQDIFCRYIKAGEALCEIAAQETPGANATVRRMARMAREGYGG